MEDATRSDLERLAPWHFDVELRNGLRTTDGNPAASENVPVVDPNELFQVMRRIFPDGLAGRSLLDVGCNGGAYCLLAHQMGAGHTYGFDSRQHWIDQAQFLTRHFGVDGARFEAKSLHEVAFDRDYDICIFKGILYHLPDPVHALQEVCSHTREMIVVDSETDGERGDLCFRLNPEGTVSLMTGMHGLAWWPSGPDLIAEVLVRLGFPAIREVFWRPNKAGNRTRPGRCRVVAARDEATFRQFDRQGAGERAPARKTSGEGPRPPAKAGRGWLRLRR